jgi:hypothetical protein
MEHKEDNYFRKASKTRSIDKTFHPSQPSRYFIWNEYNRITREQR